MPSTDPPQHFPEPFNLSGRVALITGASRGIGEASAGLLRRAGAQVVLLSRKQEGLDAARTRILSQGPGLEPLALCCHIGRGDDVQKVWQQVMERLGQVDILVNNAGTNPYFGPVLGASMEAYLKTFEVNLSGALLLSRLCGQHLLDRAKKGSIVNIASVAGLRAAPMQGLYGMTKAAIISMTQTLSMELGGGGIRVNAIAPGLVETRLAAGLIDNEAIHQRIVERTPLQRHGQPQEIAAGVLYLASDAASFVTGHTLVIDGGYTIT